MALFFIEAVTVGTNEIGKGKAIDKLVSRTSRLDPKRRSNIFETSVVRCGRWHVCNRRASHRQPAGGERLLMRRRLAYRSKAKCSKKERASCSQGPSSRAEQGNQPSPGICASSDSHGVIGLERQRQVVSGWKRHDRIDSASRTNLVKPADSGSPPPVAIHFVTRDSRTSIKSDDAEGQSRPLERR